mgnify:CR=1 FL=1
MIYFIGAGPGAADLITVKGKELLEKADLVIYAGSLVNPELLKYCKPECTIMNSATMTLEEVIAAMVPAAQAGQLVVRLHTGDPSVYGAHREQIDLLRSYNLDYEVVPGVSSFCAAAACLKAEYTLPNVSQSVIITRMEGRTPVPSHQKIADYAAHKATMVIFLSSGMLEKLQTGSVDGGYLKILPQLDEKDQLSFLDDYFSADHPELLRKLTQLNRGISIIRDCSSGSNASTLLCMDSHEMFYRKYAFGASYPSKSAINGTELQVDVHGMNYPSGVYGGPDFYETFLNYPGHEHLSGFASESSSTISSRGVYFPKGYQITSYDLKAPSWASLADAEFAALDKYPAICGEFVWTGFDYLGEPTPFNSDMSVLLNHAALSEEELAKAKEELKRIEKERPSSRSSYFGIVDLAGFPKDRYYLYKAHWMPDEPMAHILPHWNFPDRIGKITPVFVYSSGDEVELFLNGESLGRKKKEQYQYRFKWENVIYTPGELKAIAYKNGKLWATESVRTTGEPALLQVSAYKDKIKVADNELAFITVSIRDKTGSVVPTANHKIKCKLEGEGKIVATDNGDPTSLISFSATERETFNGFMLVVIKAHQGAKGKLRLIVESENLKSASVDINLL